MMISLAPAIVYGSQHAPGGRSDSASWGNSPSSRRCWISCSTSQQQGLPGFGVSHYGLPGSMQVSKRIWPLGNVGVFSGPNETPRELKPPSQWSSRKRHKIFVNGCMSALEENAPKKWIERFRRDHLDHTLHLRPEMHGGRARPGRPDPAGPLNNILFQGFNWESCSKYPWYKKLKEKVDDLAAAGITDVWLAPPSQAVDKQGYLPSQLYNLNDSKYGTKAQLEELIDSLHEHGICCIADIVINHRSGWRQDSGGHWNEFEGGTKDKRLDWGPWAVVDNDAYDSGGKGHHDTGESYGAAPDLDHTNKRVQDELTDWMNWMKADVGYDGWRFDFVKGYASKFTKLYCERTGPMLAVGELWTSLNYEDGQLALDQNAHRQILCDWIDGTSGLASAFDFTTKGVLQTAVCDELWRLQDSQGKPPGLIGWYPQRAVTFVDNHDTGSTQRHWPFPDDKVLLGYVYIITHPGIPCIFYDHFFDWGLQVPIRQLIQLRKRNSINAASRVNIQAAESDIYVANIDDRVIVKIGSRFEMGTLLPDSSKWKLATSGNDFAIWESKNPLSLEDTYGQETEEVLDDVENGPEIVQPSHPLKLTQKMSCNTVKRILKDVPELVESGHGSHQLLQECNIDFSGSYGDGGTASATDKEPEKEENFEFGL